MGQEKEERTHRKERIGEEGENKRGRRSEPHSSFIPRMPSPPTSFLPLITLLFLSAPPSSLSFFFFLLINLLLQRRFNQRFATGRILLEGLRLLV
ncbi:hypothetical protein Pcinc_041819 [Petrolisthes cinctipes]|uniref:Transmembrane protein n=1 Tax=Petrolisthes cinctipes TaxID=88211 RepID=A0AAE1BIQ2_PETCI|nr:hypothetical protein Pcinc_041819 [Petrolisthes cinctipes]